MKANREFVCVSKAGKPPAPGLSCDERPVASTREGSAAELGWITAGRALVPVKEQQQHGGKVTAFYKNNGSWITMRSICNLN